MVGIRAAILADSPLLYWPLDDASGPAASDASGNGNAGVYGGNFQLQQPGPEATTFSTYMHGTGGVNSVAQTPVLVKPYTMEVWIAAVNLGQNGASIVYNGLGTARGSGLVFSTGGLGASQLNVLRGGISSGATSYLIANLMWHQLVLDHTAASVANLYVDGALVAGFGGNTTNPIVAGDKFGCGPGVFSDSYYMAHCALWNIDLTAAQVLAHYTARVNNTEPPGSPVGLSDSLATLLVDLSSVLACVRKTY